MRKNNFEKIFFVLVIVSLLTFAYKSVFAEEEASTTLQNITTAGEEQNTLIENTSTSTESFTSSEVVASSEEVIAPSITVSLQIESATTTLFNSKINVSPCNYPGTDTKTLSAYCAVLGANLEASWSNFGGDFFLNSIAGESNDFGKNIFWLWFSNGELGAEAMNKYVLSDNEKILVTLGKYPLRISISTTTPEVGSIATTTVEEFGFDSSFNGVYTPSASSTLFIDDVSHEIGSSGELAITISTSTPFRLRGSKAGFIDSDVLEITPIVISNENNEETNPSAPASGGGGGGSSFVTFDLNKALNYLVAKQESNGSFGTDLYTDWAAIALSPYSSESRNKITEYLKSEKFSGSSITDYERRAMALESLNINPYNGTDINYIKKITDSFDGVQIGEEGLVNDDIFAIFPLIKSGVGTNDKIINSIRDFIIKEQKNDGSWEESVDLTASAAQALSLLPQASDITDSLSRAKIYLKNNQNSDGGFGSSFSTSWVLGAIASFNETPNSWIKIVKSPTDFIASLQNSDGGVESIDSPDSTRIWATSYAITGIRGDKWIDLLKSFSPPNSTSGMSVVGSSLSSSNIDLGTTTASTTEIFSQSTTTKETENNLNISIVGSRVRDENKIIISKASNVIETAKDNKNFPKDEDFLQVKYSSTIAAVSASDIGDKFFGTTKSGFAAVFGLIVATLLLMYSHKIAGVFSS